MSDLAGRLRELWSDLPTKLRGLPDERLGLLLDAAAELDRIADVLWLHGPVDAPKEVDGRALTLAERMKEPTWSEVRPTEPGPYWIYTPSVGISTCWISYMTPAGGRLIVTTAYGVTHALDDACYSDSLWHPWQASAPPWPEQEPVAGVWSDRPWRGGLHRVCTMSGTYDVVVEATASPWRTWTCQGGAEYFGVKGHLPVPCRWYRYPDPPGDPHAL